MRKKIFALFLASVASLSLVSCTGNSTEETNVTPQSESTGAISTTNATSTTDPVNIEQNETQYPVTIDIYNIDGKLVPQTFEKEPTKVIPYTAAAVTTLLELGLEDSIIGIMAPDNPPPAEWQEAYERLNIIGDKVSVSKETLIALEPDMVFGRVMSLADDTYGTVESFNEMGINVYSQKASSFAIDQSLDNIIEDVLNIGIIFNKQQEAEEYATSLKNRLSALQEKVKNGTSAKPLKALLMVRYEDGTFSCFGKNSTLQNEALKAIGIENIVDGTAGQLTGENLVALNPDIIIYVTAARNAEFDAIAKDSILQNELFADVTAVKNNKIIEIPYETLMDYGPRIFDAIEIIYDGVNNA